MQPKNLVTNVMNTRAHGEYILYDYETADEPGVLKTQILRRAEARHILEQLNYEFGLSVRRPRPSKFVRVTAFRPHDFKEK